MFKRDHELEDGYYEVKILEPFAPGGSQTTLSKDSITIVHSKQARLWLQAGVVKVGKQIKAADSATELARLDGIPSNILSVQVRAIQGFVDYDGRFYHAGQTAEILKHKATAGVGAGLLQVLRAGTVRAASEATAAEVEVARKRRYWDEPHSAYPAPAPTPDFDWDSLGDWVKILLLQDHTDGARGKFSRGAVADFPVAIAQAMVEKRVGEVVGEGSEPPPQLSAEQKTDKRFADLQSELEALRREQEQTRKATANLDILFHPTGNDKTQIRRRG